MVFTKNGPYSEDIGPCKDEYRLKRLEKVVKTNKQPEVSLVWPGITTQDIPSPFQNLWRFWLLKYNFGYKVYLPQKKILGWSNLMGKNFEKLFKIALVLSKTFLAIIQAISLTKKPCITCITYITCIKFYINRGEFEIIILFFVAFSFVLKNQHNTSLHGRQENV